MPSTDKLTDLQKDTIDSRPKDHETPLGLTTDYGVKVSATNNWLKAANIQYSPDGKIETVISGPALLEDQIAREKIQRFDHERIPERVVHARGTGAHGYFRVTTDKAKAYTFAPVLAKKGRETPVFVRFSTVAGSRGSADTVRDVRGFAIKFYTQEGNWDLIGNNIPVFFIQDAIKFPDFIHAVKPEPHNEVPQGQSAHNNFWDFVGLQPESAHMVMRVMSDTGIPRSYRMMEGFGVNTFTLINSAGKKHFVKFHWKPDLDVHSLTWDEAMKLAGQDPDFHRKDLHEALERRVFPKWKFYIQVLEEGAEVINGLTFNILDATKIWPENIACLQEVGELVLHKTVDEFFPETEQAAFCTAHIVPGIGFSDDPLLQGRNFSYFDTQISRLGVNWEQIPINRPVCPVLFNHHRGGAGQHRIVQGTVNYWPNRFDIGHPVSAGRGGYYEHRDLISGSKRRLRFDKFDNHFEQARTFVQSLKCHEWKHLINALSFELSHVDEKVVYQKYTELLYEIDPVLAKAVADKVNGFTIPEKKDAELVDWSIVPDPPKEVAEHLQGSTVSYPSLSIASTCQPSLPSVPEPVEIKVATRRIAILVEKCFSYDDVTDMKNALDKFQAFPFIIGPDRGKISCNSKDSRALVADHHFEGQRSTMFDALFIPSGEHAEKLKMNGRVVHWVREAFGHCKIIGAIGKGIDLLREALPNLEGKGKLCYADPSSDNVTVVSSYGIVTTGKYTTGFAAKFAEELTKHRCWTRETCCLTEGVAY